MQFQRDKRLLLTWNTQRFALVKRTSSSRWLRRKFNWMLYLKGVISAETGSSIGNSTTFSVNTPVEQLVNRQMVTDNWTQGGTMELQQLAGCIAAAFNCLHPLLGRCSQPLLKISQLIVVSMERRYSIYSSKLKQGENWKEANQPENFQGKKGDCLKL